MFQSYIASRFVSYWLLISCWSHLFWIIHGYFSGITHLRRSIDFSCLGYTRDACRRLQWHIYINTMRNIRQLDWIARNIFITMPPLMGFRARAQLSIHWFRYYAQRYSITIGRILLTLRIIFTHYFASVTLRVINTAWAAVIISFPLHTH